MSKINGDQIENIRNSAFYRASKPEQRVGAVWLWAVCWTDIGLKID